MVQFAVRDSGVGIPLAVQEHIFQAFAQADGTVSRKFGGTGLGLAISRQLAALMGGELELDSTPGQGSTFRFTVHLARGQQPSRRLADQSEPSDRLPVQFPGVRVLVAEDNPVNQKLAGFMLEDYGIESIFADDGKEAFDLLEHEKVDLVLMDCQMPEWDGLTATRAIRAREREQRRNRVPILALSANAMPSFDDTCRGAGMDAYLCKPLSEETLTAALQRWLPGRGRQDGNTQLEVVAEALNDAPFDLEKVRRLCRGDAGKVAEMLRLFLDSSEELLALMATALEAHDLAGAARQAHQLKGASAYLGADTVTTLAAAVEAAAKADDLETSRSAQEDLEAAFIRVSLPIRTELEP
jgi:CheY-like chemotaxis protein/HPt (histidine-containing phosphotransfer) domain-containing protein